MYGVVLQRAEGGSTWWTPGCDALASHAGQGALVRAVVVAPQPRAAEVGAQVLEAGGNVVDAAIATAFMQMAVDPFNCGIGGMGTCQVLLTAEGEHRQVDFHSRAGSRVTADMWAKDLRGHTPISGYSVFEDFRSEMGYTSIMVPGTPAGLDELRQRYATMPLGELMGPAIRALREGFPVPAYLAGQLQRTPQPGIPDSSRRVRATDACARIYLKADGTLPTLGDTLRNPDMADVFEQISRAGLHDFYGGALAARMADDLAKNGSFITTRDLQAYTARVGRPVFGSYRGYTVASNPPPGGGAVVIEMLHILEGFELGRLEHSGVEHLHLLATAMRLAHMDRNAYMGDPDFVGVPLEEVFLSDRHARRHQEAIRSGEGPEVQMPGERDSTTHLVVMDCKGNTVTMTHTLGSASGVVTPGLGFIYNNSMKLADPVPGRPNSFAPGKARNTGMCPTIVLRDGVPVLAAGAPGGSVIISAVLQALCNSIDWGMGPVEAVSAPRVHTEGQKVYVEARVRSDVCRELANLGHQVEHRLEGYAHDLSRAQLARLDENGKVEGGSDPRGDGGGVAYART
ncbi:MAG: gamma-glutamyltransferase [Chloroflexota bacterium]